MIIVGTRPEAIKVSPVYRALSTSPHLKPIVVATGQHRDLLDGVLASLELPVHHDLGVMTPNQTLNGLTARVIERLTPLLEAIRPAAVLTQGDTTSVLAASLTAYHLRIPVGHIEAGLRTYDHEQPFPEEANRQLVDRLSRWCFVPTATAAANLIAERIDTSRIHLTGNTVIDALLWARTRSRYACQPGTILVTLHRRESFGAPLREVVGGLSDFLRDNPGARALWPVHPNPHVGAVARELLGDMPQAQLVDPLDYLDLAGALATCEFVLTDSGGLQEEGPSLGKRVLVAREVTERPEGVSEGLNRLIGRHRAEVRSALSTAWEEPRFQGSLPAPSPFGDGKASAIISSILERELTAP